MSASRDVACFGEVLCDLYDEEPGASVGRTFRRELGGASANVAVTLARLGLSPTVLAAVGKDDLGGALAAELEAEGVDVSGLARLDRPTGLALVRRDANGAPSFAPYRSGTADQSLEATHVKDAACKVKIAVVGTASLATPGLVAAVDKLVAGVTKAKGVLVLDLNVRPRLFPNADAMRERIGELAGRFAVVKGSERDLSLLAGKRGLTWLEEHAKGATWLITRGENGAAAVGAHGQITAPTRRVRTIDATGAGDAFLAGVVAVLLAAGAKPSGKEWKDGKLWTRALEVGHLLSAKAVSAVGATSGVQSLDDVRAKIGAAKK